METAITRILVPVDGSPASLRAVRVADEIALASNARLDIITVFDLRSLDLYEEIALSVDQVAALENKVRTNVLDKAATLATTKNVDVRLVKGPIEKTLLKEAEGASLVVLGRTGKSAFERLLEGSVSRRLSQESPVPVMVVP